MQKKSVEGAQKLGGGGFKSVVGARSLCGVWKEPRDCVEEMCGSRGCVEEDFGSQEARGCVEEECGRSPDTVWTKSVEGAQGLCERMWREPRDCVDEECGGSPEIVWKKSVEGTQRLC